MERNIEKMVKMRLGGMPMAEIAEVMGVSKQYVSAEFKRFFGMRDYAYVRENWIFPNLKSRIKKVPKLAEKIGMCEQSLYLKLKGRRQFTLKEMCAIRDAVSPGKTLDFLFQHEPTAKAEENSSSSVYEETEEKSSDRL